MSSIFGFSREFKFWLIIKYWFVLTDSLWMLFVSLLWQWWSVLLQLSAWPHGWTAAVSSLSGSVYSFYLLSVIMLALCCGTVFVVVGCDISLLSLCFFFSPVGKDEGAMIVMEAAWSVFSLFVILLCLVQFQDMSHKTRSVNVGMFIMYDLCAHHKKNL